MALHHRGFPNGLIGKQLGHGGAVANGFVFDGPPEEQRDVFVVHVLVAADQRGDDGKAVLGGPALTGGSEAATDCSVGFVLCQLD